MNETVLKIQKRLNELGYYKDDLDGIRGRNTIRAIKNFQRDNMLVVDGIVGKNTSAKLFSNASASPSSPPIVDDIPWLNEAKHLLGLDENRDEKEILDWAQDLGIGWYDDSSTPWCLTGEAEVLTDRGFVRLDNFFDVEFESVAQVNTETHEIEWVSEFGYIDKDYEGVLYKNERHGFSCDPTHQIYGSFCGTGKYHKREIQSITNSGIGIPNISGSSVDNDDFSDEEIRFLAAYLSDGYLHNTYQVGFGTSKERKMLILDTFKYLNKQIQSKIYGISNYPVTRYTFPRKMLRLDAIVEGTKRVTWEFAKSLSRRQSLLFIETYKEFDGTTKKGTVHFEVFTQDKEMQELLCYIATMAGMKATPYSVTQVNELSKIEQLHHVYCSYMKHRTISKRYLTKEENFSGKLYCVQVPSGVFVMRTQKGIVMAMGNCGLFVAHCIGSQLPEEPLPTNVLGARNWLKFGKEVSPKLGAVMVFWRGQKSGWSGHVGFYMGEDSTHYRILGGNQSDSVSIAKIAKNRFLGSRWPITIVESDNAKRIIVKENDEKESTNES